MNAARGIRAVYTEAGAVLQDTADGSTYAINPTGAHIWRHLVKGATKNEIVDQVCADFGVDRVQVCSEVEEFLIGLEQKGLLQQGAEKSD